MTVRRRGKWKIRDGPIAAIAALHSTNTRRVPMDACMWSRHDAKSRFVTARWTPVRSYCESGVGSPRKKFPMPAQFHARSFAPDRRTRNRFCSLVDVYGAPDRGSGAPCQSSWCFLDRSNCRHQELLYSPARRPGNFRGKLTNQDRPVHAKLPMSSCSARISLARPLE
jgi:hypothetical protein